MLSTVVITTRNRRDDLRKAVQSAVEQSAKPEVLVIDDGSTDGTSEMIRAEFPQVQLHRSEKSHGYIVQRNWGAELATGDVIFSIDDDAAFSTPLVVEQTLAEFDHPHIGAVAVPFINVNKESSVMQKAPVDSGIYLTFDFIGTAHAIRREVFLQCGKYRPFFFHQGEEQDYCIRMLDQGYLVRLGRADSILHYESPLRDLRRTDLFGRRNEILFVWYNVPWPVFPLQLIATSCGGLLIGLKLGRIGRMIHGLCKGYLAILQQWSQRKPVSLQTFKLMRRLKRKAVLQSELDSELACKS